MKITINNEQTKNKDLIYEEDFWGRNKSITFDGIKLNKINKNSFEYQTGDAKENFIVKGNELAGVTINMFGADVVLTRNLSWQEIIMALVIYLPSLVFGVFGSLFGGVLAVTFLFLTRKANKLYEKIILAIELVVISMLLSYLISTWFNDLLRIF